ncbi:DNA polymerase alpha catalytic subunit-like [Ooceraea biroi]|uniref:DNA polymerase alpha catalytic subunit-like n=1 Tax=Ooceraea biroi TaxID=2015173 RepID=UPI000F080AF8|nr:DNA polymerase alpha catalytic subunit-like [Ooceraea biroi]
MDDSQPSTSGRSKRQKVDKTGRLSALERLKEARSGVKPKYEIEELENVYDEVDEKEYSNTVLKRQRDDWIVDDGESGYVEDGREIFDDDLDEESIQEARKQKHTMAGPRKRKKEDGRKKGDIQSMIRNMPSKKSTETKIKDDDILGELLSEITGSKGATSSPKPGNKNKFCHTVHSGITHRPQSSSAHQETDAKRISGSLEEHDKRKLEESNIAWTALQATDDEDFATIFDVLPEKKSANKTGQSNDSGHCRDMSEIIDNDIEFVKSQKVGSSEQVERGKDIGRLEIASRETDDPMETDISLTRELASACSKVEKDAKVDLSECVGDLSSIDFDSVAFDGSMDVDFSLAENKVKEKNGSADVQNATCKTSVRTAKIGNTADLAEVAPQLIKTKDEEEVFRFYYLDAYENPYKNPGTVYLFGKTYVASHDVYCSCCVMVNCIPRRIYLLPRKYVCTFLHSD